MTARQSAVDERLLGRANASFGFLAECTPPAGGRVAGVHGFDTAADKGAFHFGALQFKRFA